ncbi:hypothetical protein ATCC90586_012013 [Pythium insidiosum]|nr:hypothetical protein ATCC90586_012012 [Pythium insidiosum]KAJ0391856.1 hypothetical protein ATCC90586_012013 [Pythium insidiosum]
MKCTTASLASAAIVAASLLAAPAKARPMHAGIDYSRYLEEKDSIAEELSAWMDKYKDAADKNGWIPPTESRSAEEIAEDRQQRFFMSKQLVTSLKAANPDAEFSTDSPFTLMTTKEFAKYVQNSPSPRSNPWSSAWSKRRLRV